MQKQWFFFMGFIFLALFSNYSYAQNAISLKGKVLDKDSGRPLEGVHIFLKPSKQGTITDGQGNFEINNVKAGTCILQVSILGYESKEMELVAKQGMPGISFQLKQQSTKINRVEVQGNSIRKTEEALKLVAPLKDIPVTTSTISGELLSEKQFTSVNDAMKYTTGINPTVNYGGFQTFNMRGFRGPVIMVDGARDERMNFSNSAPVTSLAAVERIEYLKGPASVLYGHSAVGGIINIVRKQPSEDFTLNMKAGYGSWDTKEVAIGSGGRLADKLNYRIDVGLSDRTGWRENNDKYANAYLALDYLINENNKLEFRFGANSDFYGTETGLPAVKSKIYDKNEAVVYEQGELPAHFDREERYNDPADFLKHENLNAALKYKRHLNENTWVQFHSSFAKDIIDYFSTEELSYLTDTNDIYNHYFLKDEKRVYICLDTLQRTYPFRFSHRTNTYQNYLDFFTELNTGNITHKLVAGYYFMYVDRTTYTGYGLGEDVYGQGLSAKISVVNPVVNQGALQTKFSGARNYREMINGIYFQDLLEVSESVKILLAARYDYYHMKYRTASVKSGLDLNGYSPTNTLSFSSLTYRAGLVCQPVSSLSLYASYSSFFKPNRRVYDTNYVLVDNNGEIFIPEEGKRFFKPLTGYQLEGGVKFALTKSLHLHSSAFYIIQNNMVESLGSTDDGKKIYGQVDVVDSKGIELEGIVTLFRGMKMIVGYGLTEAKYQEFSNNDYIESSKEGNYVRQCPKNTFYSWCSYKVRRGIFENLNIGAGVNFRDKIYTETSNTYVLPEYWQVDASVGYTVKDMHLRFGVYNLMDKEYYSNYVYSNQYVPGRERNYKFTVEIKL